jgi:hypothetical protein
MSMTTFSELPIYAASTFNFTPGATPTDIFTITGSATKIIRVYQLLISTTQGSNGMNSWLVIKRSTPNTGGTSSLITTVPLDSINAPATATIRQYTANPTLGNLVGNMLSFKLPALATNAATVNPFLIFDFSKAYGRPLTLRGTGDVVALNFNGIALPNGLSINCSVLWAEE